MTSGRSPSEEEAWEAQMEAEAIYGDALDEWERMPAR